MTVFVVQHEYERDECDHAKFIGVYSTEERAQAAVERTRPLPGFRDHPEGFAVDAYELDVDHWTEGFFTDYLG